MKVDRFVSVCVTSYPNTIGNSDCHGSQRVLNHSITHTKRDRRWI